MKNVLFISIDDLNDWTNGLKGYSGKVHTPNLDKLMNSGVTFNNAYSQAAICNPSRASVLTGKNPLKTQVFNNQTDWESTVDPSETIFGVMKANGYQSIGTGKLFHSGASAAAEEVMFDDYRYLGSDRTGINLDGKPVGAYNGTEPLTDENRAEYISNFLQDYTPDPNKPLFLSAGFLQPHTDWVVPQKYFDLYPLDSIEIDAVPNDVSDIPQFALDNAGQTLPWSQDDVPDLLTWKKLIQGYLASISYMDDQVGKVVDALDNSAIADNTSVVLWSDHGYHLGDKDFWHKFTLWDNAAKAPLIIRDPDLPEPGKVIDDVVELADIFPTVLDLTDVSAAGLELDGKSLVPKINGTEAPGVENKAYTWMYGSVSLRTDEYRYTIYEDGSQELYDVVNDPELVVNLADDSAFAAVKEELNTDILSDFNLIGYGSTASELDGTNDNDIFAVNDANQIANGGKGDDIYFVRGDVAVVEAESGGRDMIVIETDKYTMPENVEVLEVREISQEILGNKSANLIAANANIIASGLGDDTVRAGNRANKVFLGAGNDFLNSYGGNDTVYGGVGNDTIQFIGGDDQIVRGEAGDDQIVLGLGNDTALGDGGNDLIKGGGDEDLLYGGDDNDTLKGEQDEDILYGGLGNDLLDGGQDNDSLYAGIGNDRASGAGGDDFIRGEWGEDELYGGQGNDTLEGNQDSDRLYGGLGDDFLNGGQGSDVLYAGSNNDRVDGESGNDLIRGEWGQDLLGGGEGDDTIEGNQDSDRLYGGFGNDFLNGGRGNDYLYAGIGNDLALGESGNDFIQGEWGEDKLYGSNGDDTLKGNQNSDRLYGGWDNDLLDGGRGNDSLYAGIGNDRAHGAAGDDFIQGEWGEDAVYGGNGNDILEGNQNRDRLYGGWDNDLLDGGQDNDSLYGGNGADKLYGAAGDDFIQGEWGDDLIYGGASADTIEGNQNRDIFAYTSASDSLIESSDTIVDFTSGTDKLQLDFSIATNEIGSVANLKEANNYFSGSSSQIAFSASESTLYVDSADRGIADMAIALPNVTALNSGDFI